MLCCTLEDDIRALYPTKEPYRFKAKIKRAFPGQSEWFYNKVSLYFTTPRPHPFNEIAGTITRSFDHSIQIRENNLSGAPVVALAVKLPNEAMNVIYTVPTTRPAKPGKFELCSIDAYCAANSIPTPVR